MREHSERPRARTSDLVIKGIGDEVLVYDLTTHRAHSLNRVAAAVWRACDGTRGVDRLRAAAAADAERPVPAEAVQYALQVLGRAGLLEGPVEEGLTRRQVMAKLGTAAAVALPAVTTIIAPTAAQAVSCKALGQPCQTNAECCGEGCNPVTTFGCSCSLFKTFGLRCLQLTPPEP